MTQVLALLTLVTTFTAASASPATSTIFPSELSCKNLEFTADQLDCGTKECTLVGNATVKCDAFQVQAETITLEFEARGRFQGLHARSRVSATHESHQLSCEHLIVESDGIRGNVEDATVYVGETRADGSPGIRAVIHGTIQRRSETTYVIRSAGFSLCDCGKTTLPSWNLRAHTVDLDITDRATLYFPVLWVSPFGSFQFPLLPIPAPLSVPMNARALGLLPPMVEFNASYLPSIKLPLFIPIGDTWDLTLAPGNRFEWSLPGHPAWSRLDAPQLYARTRFHPIPQLEGSIEVHWVYDSEQGNARNRASSQIESTSNLEDLATVYGIDPSLDAPSLRQELTQAIAESDPRYSLLNRLHLNARQSWTPSSKSGLFSDIQWVSDDFLLSDLSVRYDEQIAFFLPSRVRWVLDDKDWRLHGRFDLLQRLSNYQYGNSRTALNYGHTELRERSPGPFLEASLKPVFLTPWLTFDTSSSLLRTGTSSLSARSDEWRLLQIADFTSTGFFDSVRYQAQQTFLGGAIIERERSTKFATSVTDVRLDSPWSGQHQGYQHRIIPELSLRNIESYQSDTLSSYLEESELLASTQLMFNLDQVFHFGPKHQRELQVSLQVPVDVRSQTLLPLRLSTRLFKAWNLETKIAVTLSPRGRRIRDMYGSFRWNPIRALRVGVDYLLLTPNASRLRASLWEFAERESLEVSPEHWIHGLRPRVSLTLGQRLRLDYRTDIALPTPESPGDEKAQVLLHSADLTLNSACRHCWQSALSAQLRPKSSERAADLRLQFAFSLSGFDLE